MLDTMLKEFTISIFSTDHLRTTFSFTDCQYDYKDNKNLYAMMLPSSCKVVTINPRTNFTIAKSLWPNWLKTDLQYSLVLSKLSHVIIMYQYTGWASQGNYYFVNRIKIDSAVKKHSVSHSGFTSSIGNFGLWQGSLNSGTYTILVEYCNNGKITSKSGTWETRALTIVYC